MRRIINDIPHGVPGYAGKWNAAITDMADVAAWGDDLRKRCPIYAMYGIDGKTTEQVAGALRDGDLEMAKASEQYMASFEALSFSGRKFGTVASIAGGAPNVGAYLAGSPMSMRRRERILSTMGTLTIFVDGSSSGDVGTEPLKRRGAALLGLLRMLQAVRPVDLYVVGGGLTHVDRNARVGAYGPETLSNSVFVKINSGTMDLSRDGFAVAHPAFTRGLLYRACADLDPRPYNGFLAWEFGGHERYKKHALGAFCKVIGCDPSQSIFFSPPHSSDPIIDDPVAWIKDMLVRYGGQSGMEGGDQ